MGQVQHVKAEVLSRALHSGTMHRQRPRGDIKLLGELQVHVSALAGHRQDDTLFGGDTVRLIHCNAPFQPKWFYDSILKAGKDL